ASPVRSGQTHPGAFARTGARVPLRRAGAPPIICGFTASSRRRPGCATNPAAFGPLSMFEGIQRGLGEALKKLRGRGRLTEANMREGLQEVRKALLDADVNYKVAQDFIQRVEQQAIGQQVLRTIDPNEQIVSIVYEELVALMGPVDTRIRF